MAAGLVVAAPPGRVAAQSPASALDRDGMWRVVPARSFVGYRVREHLAFLPLPSDAVGRTSAITCLARIEHDAIVSTKVSVDARTLKSDRRRRDGAVRGLLAHKPIVIFKLTAPIALPAVRTGTPFDLRAQGTMRLHGVTREVVFPLRARWIADQLEVIGSLRIAFADYRIRSPKFGPVLSVSKHARIEVHLSFGRA